MGQSKQKPVAWGWILIIMGFLIWFLGGMVLFVQPISALGFVLFVAGVLWKLFGEGRG